MPDCEFIVVGSGAGGGTVAARLAEDGRTVVLLEAGGDPVKLLVPIPSIPGPIVFPRTTKFLHFTPSHRKTPP